MGPTDFAIARKARWAYELGRLRTASGVLLLVHRLELSWKEKQLRS